MASGRTYTRLSNVHYKYEDRVEEGEGGLVIQSCHRQHLENPTLAKIDISLIVALSVEKSRQKRFLPFLTLQFSVDG